MKILITGGCGFIGSNLSYETLQRGNELTVFDNLSREGSKDNLLWLQKKGLQNFNCGDIRSHRDLDEVVRQVKPDVVFHVAGQVAMTTSLADPRHDFETNTQGTLNLLESLRLHSPDSIVVFSSTNKVYGDLEQFDYLEGATRFSCPQQAQGFDEALPLDFRSPYGCSKGAADQYMLDYWRSFGIRSIVFRHSSIYGNRQFSTFDQGWIGWFVSQALRQKLDPTTPEFSISGNGKQVRDVLFSSDLVACYFAVIEAQQRCVGHAFNIGGGVDNSLSLLELFSILEEELNISLQFFETPMRSSDQKVFIANISKAKQYFSWYPKINKFEGVIKMLEWVKKTIN